MPAPALSYDVDCTSATHCAAALQGGLGIWDGQSWHIDSRAGGTSVDCWSASGCATVGSTFNWWDGKTWRAVAPPPGMAFMRDISCAAPKSCEVVGGFVDDDSVTLAEHVDIDP